MGSHNEKPHFLERSLGAAGLVPCVNITARTKREIAQDILDGRANNRAANRVAKLQDAFSDYAAVYVVALEGFDISKVGFSTNPLGRKKGLQTALWDEVRIYGLFWAPYAVAQRIEAQAHKLAKKEKVHRRGEWVNLLPQEAVGLVLSAMDGTECWADSGTFNRKWAPQLEELYKPGGDLDVALLKERHEELARIEDPVKLREAIDKSFAGSIYSFAKNQEPV